MTTMRYINFTSRSSANKLSRNEKIYLLPAIFFLAIIGVNTFVLLNGLDSKKNFDLISSNSAESGSDVSAPKKLLGLEEIKLLTAKEEPSTSIRKINLEDVEGELIYFVSLANDTQLAFDAESGEKLSDAVDSGSDEKDILPENLNTRIAFDQAQSIAQDLYPNSSINKIELLSSGDNIIYKVTLSDGINLAISADDGEIVDSSNAANDNSSQPKNESEQNSTPNSSESNSSLDSDPNPESAISPLETQTNSETE